LFGIFSEEIVSLWAHDDRAPYVSLGRPTIKVAGSNRGHTLDFTLRERATGKVFVAEMKCEIEYQNFRYFVLEGVGQLAHHNKPAFDAFLQAAARPGAQEVHVAGKPIVIDGAILIWGSATQEGRMAAIREKGFRDVLTIAEICHQLSSWNHEGYRSLISQRQQWCNELFGGLLAAEVAADVVPEQSGTR
jgi:hypothetical protein